MPGEPPAEGPEAPPGGVEPAVRRRLQSGENPDTKGRSGCLITGAVLGIIFGLTFAFYGLPPILRHYYGEKHVAAGQAYTSGGRSINVVTSASGSEPAGITVRVR